MDANGRPRGINNWGVLALLIPTVVVITLPFSSLGVSIAGAQDASTLTVTPARGPCDATIVLTGTGFTPNIAHRAGIVRPSSDSENLFATFANDVMSDSVGNIVFTHALGADGCAAAVRTSDLGAVGDGRAITIAVLPSSGPGVQRATRYVYTTMSSSAATGLPLSGQGEGPERGSAVIPVVPPLTLILGLVLAVVGSSRFIRRSREAA